MTLGEMRSNYILQLSPIYSGGEAKAITTFIFEEVTGLKSLYQSMSAYQILTEEQKNTLIEYLNRLMNFEPMQYILGYEYFNDLKLAVNPSVLIPRPETQDLVNWILYSENSPKTILDIGTGSGCIAISLKKHFPEATVSATDISQDALRTAAWNAQENQIAVTFFHMDILNAVPDEKYDIIVSNPPYVGEDEKKEMRPNVLNYEPELALFASDPLLFYKRISSVSTTKLHEGGNLYMEMNEYYADEIYSAIESTGLKNIEIKEDIFGKRRMIRASQL